MHYFILPQVNGPSYYFSRLNCFSHLWLLAINGNRLHAGNKARRFNAGNGATLVLIGHIAADADRTQ